MSEVRIEVISESEAREYCESHNLDFITCYIGKGYDEGKLMMLAETKDSIYDSPEYLDYLESLPMPEVKNYVIKTNQDKDGYPVNTMYVTPAKSGCTPITFDIKDAKKFTKDEAEKKAFFMNKRGKYWWKAVELGG